MHLQSGSFWVSLSMQEVQFVIDSEHSKHGEEHFTQELSIKRYVLSMHEVQYFAEVHKLHGLTQSKQV
jgi:hypothetical protein